MDERLSRSNRLPGSEKLTRPEEIGQLSKYLKSIKEVYEESTRLEDQLVGVAGYSTGKIPVIDSLGDKTIKTPENQGENPDLSQKILGVPGKKKEDSLEKKRIDLENNRETRLEDSAVRTPDNHGREISRLGEVIKKIQDVRDQRLEKKRIDLLDERSLALEDTRLDLRAMINTSLENKRIDLKDERNEKLTNKRLDLKDSRDVNLSDKIIELEEPEEIELEDKRLNIQDVRTNSLETKRINLSAEENIELEDKRLNLEDERQTKLGDTRLDLKDDRDQKLSDFRLDLIDSRETKLEDTRINLKDNREVELGDKKIELEDERLIKLGDKKVEIKTTLSDKIVGLEETGSEPSDLENKRIDLFDKRDTKLPNTRIDITDERNLNLADKKIELVDEGEVKLGNKRLDIKDENEVELSNKKIELDDSREQTLPDIRIDLRNDKNVELGDKRLDIFDDRNPELGETRIDLTDDREAELSDFRLDIADERDLELGDKKVDLVDERETELSDKILGLRDDRDVELGDKRLDIKDDRETNLPNTRLDLRDERESSLSDKILSLLDERNPELGDKRLDIKDEREPSLSDKILEITDERESELGNKRVELKDEREEELENKLVEVLENENGEPEELYDSLLELPENENGEPEELYSQFLGIVENQNTTPDSLSNKVLDIAENQNKDIPDLSSVDSIKEYTSKLSDTELYEFAMKIASEGENASGEHNGWLEKVSGLMSSYLSSDILTPKRAIEFRDAINNTLEMSYFGKQAALRVPVDTSSGTTWAKAEEAVGEQITGTNRRDALDEMIVKMVDYKRNNLPRLPGSDLVDAAKGALKNVAGFVTGSTTSHPNPMNKPLHLNGMAIPGGYGDTLYQAANNRTNFNTINEVGDIIGTVFYDRYWNSKSFKTTLEDLCPIVGKAPIASLTELKAILKSSPYFTSPGKFMTDAKGSYNTFSLDTNMYWEVTIEPFCCDNGPCSNGGYSFLPAIQEINFLNRELHGVSTNYGYWAPISGFELQKSKLSTKSLQLYEGEISYPTGMEFTNELRLTFVDDAWKSWKRYFERCAEVAVYNSVAHNSAYYSASGVTRIDKNHICIASYKNLAFNIKIYILNPQLNLINRFNLLCVLKDYAEEYVGEIDSGGTDLNVTFSIVGENPEENKTKKFGAAAEAIVNLAQQALLQAQKRITGAINSSVGLL